MQFLRKEFPNATVAIRRGHPNEAMVMMARGTWYAMQQTDTLRGLQRTTGIDR